MVEHMLIIPAQKVSEVLRYNDLIPLIKNALGKFSTRPESGIIQPLRTIVRVPSVDGFLGVMPAFSESEAVLSTKLLTFFPHNTDSPTHSAVIILFHSQTGVPQAIMDGDVITAWRTAAASAVASQYLIKGTPKTLAILGAGVQARSHYHALSHLYAFDQVRIWNHTYEKARKLATDLGPEVLSVKEAKDAVKDVDIIVTVTNSSTPILYAAWVRAGVHINAVGSCRPDWHEIEPELMRSSAVYVDSKEAAVKESGDIIISGAVIVGEIGEVISGLKQPKDSGTTIFKSLGIAIEDAVTASLVLKKLGMDKS